VTILLYTAERPRNRGQDRLTEEQVSRSRRVEIDPIVETLELFTYGLYIIGSRGADNVNGMMADWVMQVSFQPRLVGVSLEKNSTTLRNLRESGVFTVNLLAAEDRELARKFAQPRDASKIQGRSDSGSAVIYDKMRGIPYWDGELTACPVLEAGIAYLECEVHELLNVGDHVLAVGRVLTGAVLRETVDQLTNRILGWSYAG
jgi:flavin reductase (DIM6/NTAB) family NADH-FMN oxidoreductase RutF